MNRITAIAIFLLGNTHLFLSDAQSSCPVNPGHCNCMPNEASFVIWCPRTENHSFQITIKPRILGLTCNAHKNIDFEDLLAEFENLDLSSHGAIDKLYYQHCPIPSNDSFSSLTAKLNISSVRELHLLFNTFKAGKGFKEGQFRDMSSDLERIEINAPSLDGTSFNILTPGMFDGVKDQLKFISISTGAAEVLPQGLLDSLTSLELLSISEKSLKELSSDVLTDLTSLKRFYLTSRALGAIPSDLFKTNTALEHVEFGVSNLSSQVSGSLFKPLSELRTLEIRGNFLQKCSPQMFISNPKLEEITWKTFFPCKGCKRGHRIQLPSFAKGASSLKKLYIKWNRLYDIIMESDFLEGCSNLEEMGIRTTGLTELPDNIFQDARKLKSLDLSSNQIGHLQESLFNRLTNLKDLNLRDNKLQNISARVFDDQRSLESLDLSSNEIETIESFAFHYMSRLKKLSLRKNALSFEKTEPNWESLSQLEKLDLSLNNIKSTAFNIQFRLVLLSLEEINLSYNLIGPKLSQDFLRFHQNNLSLNLRGNLIEEIEPFPLHKNQNFKVYLGGNPIACNCKSLDFYEWSKRPVEERTVTIADLDLLKCGSPSNLVNMNFLDMKGDQFKCPFPSSHFPNTICPCKECTYIPYSKTLLFNCSNSGLESLPRITPSSIEGSRWVNLDISNNQINGPLRIPPELDYFNNLTRLYASSNKLTFLSPDLPPSLQLLHIDHNRMKLGNEEVSTLSSLPSLADLSLSNNNFPCNCESESLFRLLKAGDNPRLRIKDSGSIYLRNCTIGGDLRDVPISQFADEDEFCLELSTLVIIYALPAILVLLLLLTLVILSLVYKEKIIVILYQYPVFRQYFIQSDESKNPYDVFISYSHEDQEYVEGKLVNGLESPEDDPLLKYKCLLAVRDFVPGEVISEQIVRAVDSSSRTIIVLSEAFLRSEWAKYEFEIAHSRGKVIVLKIGELPDNDVIGPALMNYISQNTYLNHDHPNFWRNLRYALPHKGNSKQWRPSWLKPRKTAEQLNLLESLKSKQVPQSDNSLPVIT